MGKLWLINHIFNFEYGCSGIYMNVELLAAWLDFVPDKEFFYG